MTYCSFCKVFNKSSYSLVIITINMIKASLSSLSTSNSQPDTYMPQKKCWWKDITEKKNYHKKHFYLRKILWFSLHLYNSPRFHWKITVKCITETLRLNYQWKIQVKNITFNGLKKMLSPKNIWPHSQTVNHSVDVENCQNVQYFQRFGICKGFINQTVVM